MDARENPGNRDQSFRQQQFNRDRPGKPDREQVNPSQVNRDRFNPNQANRDYSDKPLSREELERERPQVKPWEVNPEFVPKGGYYFEVICFEGPSFYGKWHCIGSRVSSLKLFPWQVATSNRCFSLIFNTKLVSRSFPILNKHSEAY